MGYDEPSMLGLSGEGYAHELIPEQRSLQMMLGIVGVAKEPGMIIPCTELDAFSFSPPFQGWRHWVAHV